MTSTIQQLVVELEHVSIQDEHLARLSDLGDLMKNESTSFEKKTRKLIPYGSFTSQLLE